jgi:hypothetical protein
MESAEFYADHYGENGRSLSYDNRIWGWGNRAAAYGEVGRRLILCFFDLPTWPTLCTAQAPNSRTKHLIFIRFNPRTTDFNTPNCADFSPEITPFSSHN